MLPKLNHNILSLTKICREVGKKMLVLTMVFTICVTLYNVGFNAHYHRTPLGGIVVSFHPFQNVGDDSHSPIKNHTHKDLEFLSLIMQNLTIMLPILFFVSAYIALAIILYKFYLPEGKSCYHDDIYITQSMRAPPFLHN